jgi:hypothetical protein
VHTKNAKVYNSWPRWCFFAGRHQYRIASAKTTKARGRLWLLIFFVLQLANFANWCHMARLHDTGEISWFWTEPEENLAKFKKVALPSHLNTTMNHKIEASCGALEPETFYMSTKKAYLDKMLSDGCVYEGLFSKKWHEKQINDAIEKDRQADVNTEKSRQEVRDNQAWVADVKNQRIFVMMGYVGVLGIAAVTVYVAKDPFSTFALRSASEPLLPSIVKDLLSYGLITIPPQSYYQLALGPACSPSGFDGVWKFWRVIFLPARRT